MAGVVGQSLSPQAFVGDAGVALACNGPLPERRLNISLSWGSPTDAVTLEFGDGERKELLVDVFDEAALAAATQHQYPEAGSYQVILTSRAGSSTASAECTFAATD